MKTTLTALATIGALSLFSTFAGAAPVSGPASMSGPLSVAKAGAGSDLVLVRNGCGRGFHRNHLGICRRSLGPGFGRCWWVHRRNRLFGWRLVCR